MSQEDIKIVSVANNRLVEGFQLLFKYRAPFPPEDLSDAEKEKYVEAAKVMDRAWKLREILGEEINPAKAAEVFLALAEELSVLHKEDIKRDDVEAKIALIASAYGLRREESGLGNILAAARFSGVDIRESNSLGSYKEKIENGRLSDDIQEALDFMKNNK